MWHEHAIKAYKAESIAVGADTRTLPVSLVMQPDSGIAPAWPE